MLQLGFDDWGVYGSPELRQEIGKIGAKFHRFGVYWYRFERPNGVYNFGELDAVVNDLNSYGVKPILVISGFPWWACSRPSNNFKPNMFGIANPGPLSRDGLVCWEMFITVLVKRYLGKVEYFEILNEPDLTNPSLLSAGMGLKTKNGLAGVQHYLQILKVAYRAIKEINPNAKILLGGLMLEYYARSNFLNRLVAYGGKDYFDIISFHFYKPFSNKWGGLLGKVSEIKAQMGTPFKPLFLTECGCWSCDKLGGFAMPAGNHPETEQTQADYVTELVNQCLQEPLIEAMLWFMPWDREDGTPDGYRGVWRKDFYKKPSYFTFKEALATTGLTARFAGREVSQPSADADLMAVNDEI